MLVVVQRVTQASIRIDGNETARIRDGMVVLVGIRRGDTFEDAQYLADRIINMRIFADENRKMNISTIESNANIMIVSQFTLYGDCNKSRRPDFDLAEESKLAKILYDEFVEMVKKSDLRIVTGEFGEYMEVEIHNDGPVTFIIESKNMYKSR